MNNYSIALFLHVVGALAFFVALGLEWTNLRQIRNATASEQIRSLMSASNSTRRLGTVSMLTILITGIYMTAIALGRCGVDYCRAGVNCPTDRASDGAYRTMDG